MKSSENKNNSENHTKQVQTTCEMSSDNSYFKDLPFEMQEINITCPSGKTVNICDFGAVGDGITDNTQAINKAIKSTSEQGGGTVIIPFGVWSTGPISLAENINLHTQKGALVIFNPDPMLYPIIETSFEGLNTYRCISPINAKGVNNIAITGEGIFDGSGEAWRPVKKAKMTDSQWKSLVASGGVLNEKGDIWYPSAASLKGQLACEEFNNPKGLQSKEDWEKIRQWLRPVMVSIAECKNVRLEGVTFRNSPCWGVHPLLCENVIIKNVKVFNPWYSQNGDGLDLESCDRVLIADCLFDVGDDGICIKSGKDEEGRKRNKPCQDVVIHGNTVLHAHGGFVVGSEMSGGVNNIFVKNCTFVGTDVGLRFKSTRGRGGVVKNIWIEGINMTNIATEPLLFDLFYGGKSAIEDLESGSDKKAGNVAVEVTDETPSFRDIKIENIRCRGARRAMFFNGLPEMKIQNVTIKDIVITSNIGAEIVNAENVNIENTKIIPESGDAFNVRSSTNVTIDGKSIAKK